MEVFVIQYTLWQVVANQNAKNVTAVVYLLYLKFANQSLLVIPDQEMLKPTPQIIELCMAAYFPLSRINEPLKCG